MPPANSSADERLGVTIAGRYRIISQLGAGGMGTAYRAWDEQAGVPVVIKIPRQRFLEDPKFAERFRREIRLLQGLSHPHIVPIVDDGEHEGLPFVVMRFLPGGSLSNRRLRDESGRVTQNPPGFLLLWLPAVADALDAIHASGVVHRDVKPANIFFDAAWGAFVGDFGIAKIVSESDVFDREQTLTATHMGIGTPDYMAPEQFTPKAVIDGRADQYALAVIVYEMLAGVRPFTGEAANLILEIMTQPAPRLEQTRPDLPASLVAAVDRGLSKRPGDRFATCREFAAAVLRDVPPLDDEPGVARLLCPKCANLLKLPTSAAGRKGKCPKCQTEMKVADDLGAMWLLDEARRQEDAASVSWIGAGGRAAGSDEPSLEAFRPLSGTTPIRRAPRRSRRGILAWIDGHGLVVGGALALATAIPWLFPAGESDVEMPVQDKAGSTSRAKKLAIERKLSETIESEQSLRKLLAESQATVERLKSELETLRSRPSMPEAPSAVSTTTRPDKPDDEIKTAIATLKANPSDKAANGVVGRHRCFTERNWTKGLPFLAQGDIDDFANAARAELEAADMPSDTSDPESDPLDDALGAAPGKPKPGPLIRAAKRWWILAARPDINTAESTAAIREHVVDLYSRHVEALTTKEDVAFANEWLDREKDFQRLVGNKRPPSPPEEAVPGAERKNPPAQGVKKAALPDKAVLEFEVKDAKFKLKLIPAGAFRMGSNEGDKNELPVREVKITKPFYLGVTEVTNAQWKAVMGTMPSKWPEDDRPVEQVSWDDAAKFCVALSALRAGNDGGRVYRLPTEAEWEYACRAGTDTPYAFVKPDVNLGDYAWCKENANGQTHPVGTKKQNPWGLYDMHGNVWEWCSDWSGPYDEKAVLDPTGPARGPFRVRRGGSCFDAAVTGRHRSAYRGLVAPLSSERNMGFRLALVSPDPDKVAADAARSGGGGGEGNNVTSGTNTNGPGAAVPGR